MKAFVTIEKSFDDGKGFKKEWSFGDFEEFFKHEGKYLDRLCRVAEKHGEDGEAFCVTYTVRVEM